MMAITFSRQNDCGSGARITYYWENLVLVVTILVLDFLKVFRFSIPVPVVFAAENIKNLPLGLRAREKTELDL